MFKIVRSYAKSSLQLLQRDQWPRDMAAASFSSVKLPNQLDYLLVLDFEANCLADSKKLKIQEIIEFPCVKLNFSTLNIDSKFHKYVKPEVHDITSYCVELTGIVEDTLTEAQNLQETLLDFENWLISEKLINSEKNALVNSAFVTCGDWDLKTCLPNQCRYFGIPIPEYMKEWCNIKHIYHDVKLSWPRGLKVMFQKSGLKFEGHHHSGIDDATNIATLAAHLIRDHGAKFRVTNSLETETVKNDA